MIEIKQWYVESIIKYNELKLIMYKNFEEGKKEVDVHSFRSIGLADNKLPCYGKPYLLDQIQNSASLEKELIDIDIALRHQKKKLLVYAKKRIEKISVKGVSDSREYSFVRVVITRTGIPPIIEETYPEYITDTFIRRFVKEVAMIEIAKKTVSFVKMLTKQNTRITLLPQAAGFFLHESIGHLLEEDIYKYFKQQLQTIHFPKRFSLKDNPSGYETLIGMNHYDDLGNIISPMQLIKDGKIRNPILLDTGFARSEKFDNKPLARMRMLELEAVREETFSEKKGNIVVSKIHSGQVTPANFTFFLKGEGYIAKEHRIIQNIVITGNLKDSIESIDDIGKKQMVFSADCEKRGQIVRVGSKSPSLSIVCNNFEGAVYE